MMMAPPDADLTVQEIDRICHPLVQRAAKVRYLRKMGLTVRETRQGDPLVNRQHYNDTMCGRVLRSGEAAALGPAANDAPDAESIVVSLQAWHSKRKARRGTKA